MINQLTNYKVTVSDISNNPLWQIEYYTNFFLFKAGLTTSGGSEPFCGGSVIGDKYD